jgi:D-glycero-D-manno-heptose 1,7-bisphosphate phosphatase
MSKRRAVFIDRDGTLNVEVNYLHRVADLALTPGAAEAVRALNQAGYLTIVVTNQAGIARGYYDEAALHTLHAHLAAVLATADAHLDAIYFCPHHPDFGVPCDCRKPAPGMLLRAAAEHDLDLGRCWLIGDTAGDIEAGRAAGCRTVLVRTGYGTQTEAALDTRSRPDAVQDDIGAAVRYILAQDSATATRGV